MEELYAKYKPLLYTLAYQMTGSSADAEDAVQDVFVKAHDIHPERLEEPKAYLCKMVTNRCLNLQKSARKNREMYVGPWLPEPIRTPEADRLEETVVRRDLLSYAMLVLLERLTPTERAVFVLREALGFEYREISDLLSKHEANCRKLMSRAKSKMGISGEGLVTADTVDVEWVNRFVVSLEQGNVSQVLSLLTDDVLFISDGGGKVIAAVHPIETRVHVARILLEGFKNIITFYEGKLRIEAVPLNGETGLVFRSGDEAVGVIFIQLRRGKVAVIFFVRNPDKLAQV